MKTLIKNIGLMVSGDIERPLLEGDSIAIADGRIAAVGKGLEDEADTVIDAKGGAVIPGLIDSHCHPVFGDFTPRQRTMDFIESGLNGGITTMISAGEVHLPGRPKDIAGLKALAVVAAKASANLRPFSSSASSRRISPRWPATASGSWARSAWARSGPARTRRPWSAGRRSTA
jgi:enamidase